MADKQPSGAYRGLREFSWMAGLLDFFGLRPLVLSALAGVMVGVWSYVVRLPGPTIVVYTMLAGASVTFLAMVGTAMRARKGVALVGTSGGIEALKEIRNQTFHNETVTLDGHDYINCDFHDCSFRFDGGNFRITACRIHGGERRIKSANLTVVNTLAFAASFGMIPKLGIGPVPASPNEPPQSSTS